jgi:hypothetical protein
MNGLPDFKKKNFAQGCLTCLICQIFCTETPSSHGDINVGAVKEMRDIFCNTISRTMKQPRVF